MFVGTAWAQDKPATSTSEPAKPTFTVPEPPALTEAARRLLDDVNKRIVNINTAELQAQLKTHPETVVIDVRTPAELA
jgi:hypothetical protein